MERHITWYTHKNPNVGECPICAVFLVCRGLQRQYEAALGPVEQDISESEGGDRGSNPGDAGPLDGQEDQERESV